MASLGYFSANWMDNINNVSFMEEIEKYILVEEEENMCNGCFFSSTENCLEITDDKCMEYDNLIWKEK